MNDISIQLTDVRDSLGQVFFTFSNGVEIMREYEYASESRWGSYGDLLGVLTDEQFEQTEAAVWALGDEFDKSMSEREFIDALLAKFLK